MDNLSPGIHYFADTGVAIMAGDEGERRWVEFVLLKIVRWIMNYAYAQWRSKMERANLQ